MDIPPPPIVNIQMWICNGNVECKNHGCDEKFKAASADDFSSLEQNKYK